MATAPRPRTTTRDPEELGRRLTAWLDRHLPGAGVTGLAVPGSNGMSSETLLFDLDHPDAPYAAAPCGSPQTPPRTPSSPSTTWLASTG